MRGRGRRFVASQKVRVSGLVKHGRSEVLHSGPDTYQANLTLTPPSCF